MLKIKWKIIGMTVMPILNDKSNVVVSVNCLVSAIDGNLKADVEMTKNLKFDDGQNFVDYELLTEEKVLEWVKTQGTIETNQAEKFVQEFIENQKNPKVVAIEKPLPW